MTISGTTDHRTGFRDKLMTIAAGKRSKWVVLAFWLVLVFAVAPLAGRLSSVEENDASAFLPDDAESLQVALLEDDFRRGDVSSAVVVYHRDEGLTVEDQTSIETDRAAVDRAFADAVPGPVIPSEDGTAAIFTIPLSAEDVIDNVELVRETIQPEDGLQARVTGQAGYVADLVAVFQDVDIKLVLATASVVAILLLITYRSPVLWLIPLVAVAVANFVATAAVYLLAKEDFLTVNGQSGGLLPVLVFGVGTDYALLLIARYREELGLRADKHDAMVIALRRVIPAILASAGTVVLGLLCLLFSDLNSNQSLGIVGPLGILAALAAMTMVLPALLVVLGRRVFWPFVPNAGIEMASSESTGFWARLGTAVASKSRVVWIATVAVLAVLALGIVNLDTNLAPEDQFRNEPEAIEGQKIIARSFAAGTGAPSTVIAATNHAGDIRSAIADTPGVTDVETNGEAGGLTSFSVTLDADPGTGAAFDIIEDLRNRVHQVSGAGAIVGGPDAESLDVERANARDLRLVAPLILAAVAIVLALLLRSVVAPLVLVSTVVLSFGAAFGASILVFENMLGFAAVEPSVPILGFVFLVALGIDYNIFLVSRIHEEAGQVGTREGTLRGLRTTGGVITSAGLVLAATFAVLGILPLVSMAELGFLVAFGVLLDTLIVRSILVPALAFELGHRLWWPGRLSRPGRIPTAAKSAVHPIRAEAGSEM